MSIHIKIMILSLVTALASVVSAITTVHNINTYKQVLILESTENKIHAIKNFNECIDHRNLNCDHFVTKYGYSDLLDSLHMTTEWITYNHHIMIHNDSMAAEMVKFRYDYGTRKWELK